MKRGRKRTFYESEAKYWAEQGLTCQQIADRLTESNGGKTVHYNSIRYFLTKNGIDYTIGKIGRPRKYKEK